MKYQAAARKQKTQAIVSWDISFLFNKKTLFLLSIAGLGAYLYHRLQQEENALANTTPIESVNGQSPIELVDRLSAIEEHDTNSTHHSTLTSPRPDKLKEQATEAGVTDSQRRLTEENLRRHAEELATQGEAPAVPTEAPTKIPSPVESAESGFDAMLIQQKLVGKKSGTKPSEASTCKTDRAESEFVMVEKSSKAKTSSDQSPTVPACALFQQAPLQQVAAPAKKPFSYFNPWSW